MALSQKHWPQEHWRRPPFRVWSAPLRPVRTGPGHKPLVDMTVLDDIPAPAARKSRAALPREAA